MPGSGTVGGLPTSLVGGRRNPLDRPTRQAARQATIPSAGSDRPLVADLNAIAPAAAQTSRERSRVPASTWSTARSPARRRPGRTRPGSTSPAAARTRSQLCRSTAWSASWCGSEVGLASAVKMSTASVYKGRVAVLAQALRAAHANGVLDPVLDDLVETGLAAASAPRRRSLAPRRKRGATSTRCRQIQQHKRRWSATRARVYGSHAGSPSVRSAR